MTRRSAWTILTLGASLLLTAGDSRGQEKKATKKSPGAARKAPSNIMERVRQRLDRGDLEAKLPKDVEWIKPKKSPGRENLPLTSGKNLGRPLTPDQLNAVFAADLGVESLSDFGRAARDEEFVRRAFLDIIGQLPAPADIAEYVEDRRPDKKQRLVDRLLETPQYGQNWARYWRDVVAYRATVGIERLSLFNEEPWLAEQFNRNVPWDKIVTEMLTAKGLSDEVPSGFLMGSQMGMAAELAGETARIFLGIQIACAQCHDHPTDTWKRDQFHELASFFGRTAVRQRPDLAQQGRRVLEVAEAPARREYRKPDLQDPSKPGEPVTPVFLTGQEIPRNTSDEQRRRALAEFITSKRNTFFAKAFVNRIWSELMGAGFTSPIDDIGKQQEVVCPKTFDALAKSFAASNYDVKALFRTILLSSAYDRTFHDSSDESESSRGGISIARLSADQIFDSLDLVLGGIDDGRPNLPRRLGTRGTFRQVFGYDPSLPQDELEGSIPQALLLMNNPGINSRIDARRPGTLLSKLLTTQPSDQAVATMLYLKVLARKPTEDEIRTCLQHVQSVGDRREAFEDILWALINSTEFLHNH